MTVDDEQVADIDRSHWKYDPLTGKELQDQPVLTGPHLSEDEIVFANTVTAIIKNRAAEKKKRDQIGQELASRIKAARLAFKPLEGCKPTQNWLAKQLGVSRPAVAQWETKGLQYRTTPSVEMLMRISQVLNVPMSAFLIEPAQQPVAWMVVTQDGETIHLSTQKKASDRWRKHDPTRQLIPLYAGIA
jgi:transcriptional regulator with XRE-family HTH domain